MVGRRDVETLAHEAESFLRRRQDAAAPLTADDHVALVAVTQRLEGLVITGEGPGAKRDVAATAGRRHVRVHYTPDPALAARGISVGSVRARLQELGEIVQAAPRIGESGEIAFEFVLATDAEDAALAALEADGLRWEHEAVVPPGPASRERPRATADPRSGAASAHFVRVDVARLDELMRVMGDLVVTRARLGEALAEVEAHLPPALWRVAREHTQGLERQLRELRDGVMRVRMVQIGDVFERMTFVARDLAREHGKRLRLDISGARTEVDKFVVDRLADPLLHLVRNAVSHGIEPPAERLALGKGEDATLALRATTAGDSVIIEVEDNGRGIDTRAVVERARQLDLPLPEGSLTDDDVLDLLCAPGFSTRDAVDRASGRGIGMAVVRRVVAQMGGVLTLDTRPGHGARFTIRLPLTLAITEAIIATVADRTYAVPQAAVREVLDVPAESVRLLEAGEVVPYRGGALPLVRLAKRFALAADARPSLHVFVTGSAESPIGIAVDRIVGQREIVVRTLTDRLVKVPGVAGATQLGDGRVVLILDVPALVRAPRRSLS